MLWGAVVVSIIVLLLFGAVAVMLFLRALPDGSHEVALVVMGAVAAKFGDVVAFWLGSSSSSMHKTELLKDKTT
jgi:hypothetical protein